MGRWIWVMFLNFRCFAIMPVKNKVPSLQSPCERSDNYTLLINGLFRGKKVTFYDRHCCVVSDVSSLLGGFRKPFLPRSGSGYGLHGTCVRGLSGEDLLITSGNKWNLVIKDLSIPDLWNEYASLLNGWVGWNNRYFLWRVWKEVLIATGHMLPFPF